MAASHKCWIRLYGWKCVLHLFEIRRFQQKQHTETIKWRAKLWARRSTKSLKKPSVFVLSAVPLRGHHSELPHNLHLWFGFSWRADAPPDPTLCIYLLLGRLQGIIGECSHVVAVIYNTWCSPRPSPILGITMTNPAWLPRTGMSTVVWLYHFGNLK